MGGTCSNNRTLVRPNKARPFYGAHKPAVQRIPTARAARAVCRRRRFTQLDSAAAPRARTPAHEPGPGTAPPLYSNSIPLGCTSIAGEIERSRRRWRRPRGCRLWALSRDPQVRENLPNHRGSSMVASRRSRPPHSGQARTSIWNVRRRSSAHACEAEPYEMGLGRAITILPRAELGVLRAAHHRRSKCREQPSRRLPAFWRRDLGERRQDN